jgi:hypothetical protein
VENTAIVIVWSLRIRSAIVSWSPAFTVTVLVAAIAPPLIPTKRRSMVAPARASRTNPPIPTSPATIPSTNSFRIILSPRLPQNP